MSGWQEEKYISEVCSPSHSRVEIFEEFPLAPMGVLAPMSGHAGHSAQHPINVSGNFPAGTSAEMPSNNFPNPAEVISEVSELHDKSF